METISSLLSKQLGSKEKPSKKDGQDLSGLPKALQDLVKAVNKSAASKEKGDNASSADKRQGNIDMLQRAFNANVQELNDVLAALNETQADALQQAEKRAKQDDARHRREEAARKRAEKLNEVSNRQAKTKANLGAGLIGALFGQALGEFTKNALAAQEQTKEDVASVVSARYDAKVGAAEDVEAAKSEGAETVKEAAVSDATQKHIATMEKETAALGDAVLSAKANDAILAGTEAAKAALEAASAARDKIEKEGAAKLSGAPSPAERASGGVSAAGLSEEPKQAPLIVTPSGGDALAEASVERTRADVAARNLEAGAAVASASDAFAEATRMEGAASAKYTGAVLQGESAVAAIQGSVEETAAAVKNAEETEINTKASAVDEARGAKEAAFAEKMEGSLVSKEEASSIGRTNMLTGAVAPPAVVVIGKVMEKFRDLFPVIEQTGDALIEMGTVIPATMVTSMGQLSAKLLYGLASLRDALWTPDVRKRYDASDAAYVATYKKSRADFYGKAQEARVAEEKAQATSVVLQSPDDRLLVNAATTGPVRANAPKEYTSVETPDAQGATGNASTAAEARRESLREASAEEMRGYRPNSAYTPPLGVVPVSASNRSVDEWR